MKNSCPPTENINETPTLLHTLYNVYDKNYMPEITRYQAINIHTTLPFKLLTHFGSKFLSKLSSKRLKSSGTSGRASRANSKSI